MQQHTHYSSARPFGCVLFVTDGQHLYQINPSGDFINSFACAAGKRSPNARVELEKLMGDFQSVQQDKFGHLKKTKNDGGLLKDKDVEQALKDEISIMWTTFEEQAND